jgi:hypothetical protein
MSTENRDRLHPTIDAKLSSIARSLSGAPTWYEPWHRLGPESTGEERLLVCRAIRDSGTLPADVGYFLMSWVIENLSVDVESKSEDDLQSMNRRESRRASDRIFADLMHEHGERQMADLFRTDPPGHARRREAGRRFFFRVVKSAVSEDPGWLKDFAEVVSSGLMTGRASGKLGLRYRVDGGSWEISVYPLPAGAAGEGIKGPARSANVAWDIEKLRSVFDRIDGSGWYAACSDETESPYVWLEGEYQDHEVFLRLLAGEPDHLEPGDGMEVWPGGE